MSWVCRKVVMVVLKGSGVVWAAASHDRCDSRSKDLRYMMMKQSSESLYFGALQAHEWTLPLSFI